MMKALLLQAKSRPMNAIVIGDVERNNNWKKTVFLCVVAGGKQNPTYKNYQLFNICSSSAMSRQT